MTPFYLRTITALVLGLVLSYHTCPVLANSGGGHGGGSKKEAVTDQKNKKKEATSITGGQGVDDPVYLHLSPLSFPVIDKNGAQQIVSMILDLQIVDRVSAEKMQTSMPILKDALLSALYSGSSNGGLTLSGHMLNIPKIKETVAETVDELFGKGLVQNVLVQALSQLKL